MGKAGPFFQVGIIGEDGRELGTGEEGELAIRVDQGGGACWIFKGASPSCSCPLPFEDSLSFTLGAPG